MPHARRSGTSTDAQPAEPGADGTAAGPARRAARPPAPGHQVVAPRPGVAASVSHHPGVRALRAVTQRSSAAFSTDRGVRALREAGRFRPWSRRDPRLASSAAGRRHAHRAAHRAAAGVATPAVLALAGGAAHLSIGDHPIRSGPVALSPRTGPRSRSTPRRAYRPACRRVRRVTLTLAGCCWPRGAVRTG